MAASPTFRPSAFKSHTQVELDDHYLIALAKQGKKDAYDRIVKRYYGFVRLKASSYFLIGGDADDLIQEGLVGLYKAVRDYRTDRARPREPGDLVRGAAQPGRVPVERAVGARELRAVALPRRPLLRGDRRAAR